MCKPFASEAFNGGVEQAHDRAYSGRNQAQHHKSAIAVVRRLTQGLRKRLAQRCREIPRCGSRTQRGQVRGAPQGHNRGNRSRPEHRRHSGGSRCTRLEPAPARCGGRLRVAIPTATSNASAAPRIIIGPTISYRLPSATIVVAQKANQQPSA